MKTLAGFYVMYRKATARAKKIYYHCQFEIYKFDIVHANRGHA